MKKKNSNNLITNIQIIDATKRKKNLTFASSIFQFFVLINKKKMKFISSKTTTKIINNENKKEILIKKPKLSFNTNYYFRQVFKI